MIGTTELVTMDWSLWWIPAVLFSFIFSVGFLLTFFKWSEKSWIDAICLPGLVGLLLAGVTTGIVASSAGAAATEQNERNIIDILEADGYDPLTDVEYKDSEIGTIKALKDGAQAVLKYDTINGTIKVWREG